MMQPNVNAHLMQTLNFTPEDLAANRAGSLTDAQRERIKTLVAQGMRIGLSVAVIVILIVAAVCGYIILGSRGIVPVPEEVSGSNAPLVVGVMGAIMVFYVIMLVVASSQSKRMASGNVKVKALTGKVKVSTYRMRGNSATSAIGRAAGASNVSYIVKVGRETIYSTDEAVLSAFEPNSVYRLYVVGKKPSCVIVSAEAVPANR